MGLLRLENNNNNIKTTIMPSYNPDKGAVKGLADRGRAKIFRHMGGRGVKFDSTTNKGIKGLGNPDAEGKYI